MIEMVNRLSRAFADREGWVWDDLDRLEDTSFGWGRNHIRQHIYETIRAMREPTPGMIEAARVAWRARRAPMATGRDGRGDGGGLGTLSRPGWETKDYQVMIDAALVSERGAEE